MDDPQAGPGAGLNGYWPPFASLATRPAHVIHIDRGEGAVVWDTEGHEYIDATASLWYANVGHGRREIADAVAAQLSRLAAYSNFGDFSTEPTERLAARVAAKAPMPDALVFLTSGGSDAVDTAVKIARRYWTMRGQPHKVGVISRDLAYHGMHGFGTALAGIPANGEGYGDEVTGGASRTATNDPDALERRIQEIGPERLAAVFAEPVIGAGGVIPPAQGYLKSVQALCESYDLLFVADEVVTGFGRVGTWFASERFDLSPDLLLVAKGITSGYAPLGGVIAAPRVWEAFRDSGTVFRHGYTYSGHAAAAAAAMANLDILEREGLVERVHELEPVFAGVLNGVADLDVVAQIRHIGLLGAVELAADVDGGADRAVRLIRERGILTRALPNNGLQFSPPFVVSTDQLDAIGAGVRDALAQL